MGTSTSSSAKGRPRSLADDLRARSDEQLQALLSARPDLVHPVPTDITQLAVRATTSPSVGAALDALNKIQLSVCEVFATLPEPVDRKQIHAGLKKALGYSKAIVDESIDALYELGLLWGASDELHLVRVARESFGSFPCGLATEYRSYKSQVREYHDDPATLTTLMASAPEDCRAVIEQLLWKTPVGSMRNAQRKLTLENAKSPLEWLLVREVLVATSMDTVVVPREVALILRDGQMLQELNVQAPLPDDHDVDTRRLDETGAHAALDFIRLVETLLEAWSIEPPTQLKGGGLAIRDLAGAVELLRVSEHITALVIEISAASGLLSADDAGTWLPTTAYDRWLNSDDATRWSLLATTWRDMTRAPHTVGGDSTERINALTTSVERGFISGLRHQILDVFAELPTASAATAESITNFLDWHKPRRSSLVRKNAIAAIVEEAATIGITALGALTSFGRALVEINDPTSALNAHIPAPIDHIIIQADLTALAPGRLPAAQSRTMSVLSDVESTGVATTYRFTENSIRRALDLGQSAHDIITFLTGLSKTPVPQPLTYLIDDVARKHGALRVGVASIYLRCDDEQLIASVQADRRLASLKFRLLAPGIVVSSTPADVVLEKLRAAGYAPVAESAEGTVLIHRPDTRRSSARPTSAPVTTTTASARLINAAVKALRAGERASDVQPTTSKATRNSTSNTITVLNAALGESREVWIGYADKSGITSERIIEPLSIQGGFLTAFDVRTNEVKTFTMARITGAEFVEGNADD